MSEKTTKKKPWDRIVKDDLEHEWTGIALPDTLKIRGTSSILAMGHSIRTVVYQFDTTSGRRIRYAVYVNGSRRMDDKVAGI